MQQDDNRIKLILEKYKYLYLNKDLILALCIEKKSDGNFYLNKSVDSSIVECYKNFIMDNKTVDKTDLYNYIEFIKNNSYYYPDYAYRINKLRERRKLNIYLRNIPTFSVWKILDYIREYYCYDDKILKELDIYYNIERFVLIGSDWTSGYFLNVKDWDNNFNKLSLFPSTYIIARGDYLENGDFTIFNYPGNEYEREDNYLEFNFDKCNSIVDGLTLDENKKLYSELNTFKIKKLQK